MEKMLRNSKRSAIEIQFNWIFVLIAGTVIFVFIISLILSQKKDVDVQISQNVLKQLATNIKGRQQLSDTFSEMETPQTTFTFTCDNKDLIADFKISDSQREPLPLEIIFAPKEFKTQKLKIWTLDFNMPFTVTRFIYVIPSNMIFIIYNSTPASQQYAIEIYNALPANITKRYVDRESNLQNILKGFKNYRIICFNDCPSSDYKFISILPLNSNGHMFSYGKVKYNGVAQDNANNPYYIGQASLFGAIFSDDEKYYYCEMSRAFKQFEIKRTLYFERVKLLETDLNAINPSCVPVFALPRSTLESMKNKKLEDTRSLYELSNTLMRDNNDLTFKGCPLIY